MKDIEVGNWVLRGQQLDELWDAPIAKLRNKSNINIALTKKLFDECPFKDYIFQGQNVMFIILSGSSLSGLIDDYSDCDLNVFIDKPYAEEIHYSLYYLGKHIHWYYKTLDWAITKPGGFLSKMGLCQLVNFDKTKHLLYLNPAYEREFNMLVDNVKLLFDLGMALSADSMRTNIELLLNYEKDRFYDLPLKFYHKMVDAFYEISGQKKDIPFLLRLKRMRYRPLENDDMERLKSILIELDGKLDYYIENSDELMAKWNAILSEPAKN